MLSAVHRNNNKSRNNTRKSARWLKEQSPADSLKEIHKVHSMRINWTIEFRCYCCVCLNLEFSHHSVLSLLSLLLVSDWLNHSERTLTRTKEWFFSLSFWRVNLFKNKSVFFPVRSALVLKSGTVQGNIHLRTASNERKKNVNLSRWKKNVLDGAGLRYEKHSRIVPCTRLINIHFEWENIFMWVSIRQLYLHLIVVSRHMDRHGLIPPPKSIDYCLRFFFAIKSIVVHAKRQHSIFHEFRK